MKLQGYAGKVLGQAVAPFTGAWIEMIGSLSEGNYVLVAPFTGAWIEIRRLLRVLRLRWVAPFTGAWIEI